jgi:hypothetical protein
LLNRLLHIPRLKHFKTIFTLNFKGTSETFIISFNCLSLLLLTKESLFPN